MPSAERTRVGYETRQRRPSLVVRFSFWLSLSLSSIFLRFVSFLSFFFVSAAAAAARDGAVHVRLYNSIRNRSMMAENGNGKKNKQRKEIADRPITSQSLRYVDGEAIVDVQRTKKKNSVKLGTGLQLYITNNTMMTFFFCK